MLGSKMDAVRNYLSGTRMAGRSADTTAVHNSANDERLRTRLRGISYGHKSGHRTVVLRS